MELPIKERVDREYVRHQGRLKTARDALMLADTARVLASENAVADAWHSKSLGQSYKPPEGEEVIHVGDIYVGGQQPPTPPTPPTPPQQQATQQPQSQASGPVPSQPRGIPSWLKTAGLIAAMGAAGAIGPAAMWLMRDDKAPAAVDTDTDTRSDFELSQE